MRWLSTRWKLLVMIVPGLALFTAFIVYPVCYSVYYSLTDFKGFKQPHFNGLQNYHDITQDPIFWKSVENTGIVLVIAIALLIPASFGLALLMNTRFPGVGVLRALAFTPNIVAPILTGLIWVFMLDPKIGVLNAFLRALKIPWQPEWIGGKTLTPFSISVVFIWGTIGFAMTIFWAGLQVLPPDVLEAASLDGASRWQQVRYLTIPMMRDVFAIIAILVFTGALRVFELVYQLSGGGPVHVSEVMVSYMYYVTFTLQHYGQGMALAVIITILGAVGSFGYVLLTRERKQA
jgi:raffinose/stachyose/melibiose transport system permease protein